MERVTTIARGASPFLLAAAILLLAIPPASAQVPAVTGTLTSFQCAGLTFTAPADINDSGAVVGRCGPTSAGPFRAFVFPQGTNGYSADDMTLFDYPGAASTEAWGINEASAIVGFYLVAGDPLYHGFIRQASGTIEAIADIGQAVNTMPEDLNDAGYVVGCQHNFGAKGYGAMMHAWVSKDGALMPPAVPFGATETMHTGVNESGTVVGYAYVAPAGNLSYVQSGVDLVLFSYPGAAGTYAQGLNQAGDVVGYVPSGVGVLRLHDRTVKRIAVDGASLTRAFGINQAGAITGFYKQGSVFSGFVLAQ
jgi:uncharacterized membrane protein